MQFFIHRYSIVVQEDTGNLSVYHRIIDAKQIAFSASLFKGLSGCLLLVNVSVEYFKQLLLFLDKHEQTQIQQIVVVVEDLGHFRETLSEHFEIVSAAGGVIQNQDKCLMIFRRGKWDLPKGKIDEGEEAHTAAIREVAEECNLEAEIEKEICSTWHHYWIDGKIVLKETKWYLMHTSNPSAIKPQAEEDIEKIEWKNKTEIDKALQNSFSSIKYVMEQFYDMVKHS